MQNLYHFEIIIYSLYNSESVSGTGSLAVHHWHVSTPEPTEQVCLDDNSSHIYLAGAWFKFESGVKGFFVFFFRSGLEQNKK
jgi:hypothetical protein